jgi:DNA-binding response OmpR family regulator
MKHILVVDDDRTLLRMIGDYLDGQDFRVSAVAEGRMMERILAEDIVDLVILDIKLENEDGLMLMRDLRTRSDVPIIVLTGSRRDEVDRVVGLELGADDYVTKPFSQRELLARIRAVLRRGEMARSAPEDDKSEKFRFAGWQVNLRTRRLNSPEGTLVPLTKGEFNLLIAFLRSPQRVLSRAVCMRMKFSTAASMFKSCACAGSWKPLPASRNSSGRNGASATCSTCPWKRSEGAAGITGNLAQSSRNARVKLSCRGCTKYVSRVRSPVTTIT